jgi:hypothetical protein
MKIGNNMKIQWLLLAIAGLFVSCSPTETGTRQPAQVTEVMEAGGAAIPRGPNGKPDLNGIWQVLSTANNNLEAHAPKAAYQLVPGDFVPVPAPEVVAMGAVGAVPAGFGVVDGGTIPYKPEALAQRDENRADWLNNDPEVKCYMPGVPRATYLPHPFQIFQSESAFFMAYSFAGAVRNVFLEDPGPAPLDSWMGQSWGQWDGDTWVVEASGMDDRTWFDRAGNYHTYQLKVTERYTMVSENVIEYSATMEDPDIYERPWTIRMPLYRRLEAGFELPQFKCVEFVEEMMYGRYRKGREAELGF